MSKLDFVSNVTKGVETLGVSHAPIIYALARVKWESVEDRDEVFNYLAADDG